MVTKLKIRDKTGDRVSILARLRSDTAGNTLAMMAAAMVPLTGLVGSAVDMGRIYATKTRLQHACDSAVLAGRKVMKGDVFAVGDEKIATDFFRSNFADQKYGTTASGVTFNASGTKLTGNATATVPMSLMKIFGYTKNDLAVTCTADLNLPNTDIMFVLDTTGSMEEINPGDTETRMVTMRKSVKDFHATIEAAKSGSPNIRYGFVPYSQTVNVGRLLKPEWIADSWDYQSRVPDGIELMKGTVYQGGWVIDDQVISGTLSPPTSTNLTPETCIAPASTLTSPRTDISRTDTPYAGPPAGTQTIIKYEIVQNGTQYWLEQTPTSCKLWQQKYTDYKRHITEDWHPYQQADWTAYWWKYKQVTYDTSGLTVGGYLTTNTGYNHTERKVYWNGCIEERSTTKSAKYTPIPVNAYDMNIDMVPDGNPKTQWGPSLPGVVWTRQSAWNWDTNEYRVYGDTQNYEDYAAGAYASCPSPARKLAPISSAELDTYVNSLQSAGNTYHDIGMIWGARLLSPTGIFKSENAGTNTSRHLIFMTDGDTNSMVEDYEAYGVSALDRRRASDKSKVPNKAEMDQEVEDRFTAMCEEVRKKNITVWVIAFGTTLTPLLENCADKGKSFQADNASELNTAFANIAKEITQLRLTD